MHYYIDGYNLLFRMFDDERDLKGQRERLIEEFKEKFRNSSIQGSLVFDAAYREEEISRSHIDDLEIVYTSFGESADEYILSEISRSKKPERHIIVTSDRQLARKGRDLGAKTESVQVFYKNLSRGRGGLKKKQSEKPRKVFLEPQLPMLEHSENEYFEFYLQAFESRIKPYAPNEGDQKSTPRMTDLERWRTIFENRLKEDPEA